jgi:Helicase conserved C-terminal domain
LKHNNIDVLDINGKISQRERSKRLKEFKESGRDGPRVLLISSVASVGLNIPFANILVIVVRTHSVSSAKVVLMRAFNYHCRTSFGLLSAINNSSEESGDTHSPSAFMSIDLLEVDLQTCCSIICPSARDSSKKHS